MRNKLQISIPTPCHENWDAMTASTNGRFCGSCQKEVVDFSGKTDAEILAFFEKYESPCIRIETHRLDKPLVPLYTYPLPRTPYRWYRPLITAALIATMSVTNVYAQKIVGDSTHIRTEQRLNNTPNSDIWRGKVVDIAGKGVAATLYYQYGNETAITIKTDADGNWEWDKTGITFHQNWHFTVHTAQFGTHYFAISPGTSVYTFVVKAALPALPVITHTPIMGIPNRIEMHEKKEVCKPLIGIRASKKRR
jgi:hypothetical protein